MELRSAALLHAVPECGGDSARSRALPGGLVLPGPLGGGPGQVSGHPRGQGEMWVICEP